MRISALWSGWMLISAVVSATSTSALAGSNYREQFFDSFVGGIYLRPNEDHHFLDELTASERLALAERIFARWDVDSENESYGGNTQLAERLVDLGPTVIPRLREESRKTAGKRAPLALYALGEFGLAAAES